MAQPAFDPSVSLEDLRAAMAEFVREREWQRFHTPRNLLLAMTGEVGELAEIFQWRGEVPPGLPGWEEKDKVRPAAEAPSAGPHHARTSRHHTAPHPARTTLQVHLGEELSDVLLYLIRLADICGVDLPTAAIRKMQLNGRKYPVEKARGRADKYTQYATASEAATTAAAGAAAGVGAGAAVATADSAAATAVAAPAAVSWKPLLATAGAFAGIAVVSLLLKRAR